MVKSLKDGYMFGCDMGDALAMHDGYPCGQCIACRINRTSEWARRCMHELHYHKDAVFLTLTYDNQILGKDMQNESISPEILQAYWKEIRNELRNMGTCKQLGVPHNQKIKYFACGEYGGQFGRPHYHAIVYGLGVRHKEFLSSLWGYGFVTAGTVTLTRCRYVASYVIDKVSGVRAKEMYGDRTPPFVRVSQGLGRKWCEEHASQLRRDMYISEKGNHVQIPRYYRKRLDIDSGYFRELSERKSREAIKYYLTEYEYGKLSIEELRTWKLRERTGRESGLIFNLSRKKPEIRAIYSKRCKKGLTAGEACSILNTIGE
jgi:hypothetical protein